jgi:hypothetical protein
MLRMGFLNQFSPLLLQQTENLGTLLSYLEPTAALAWQILANYRGLSQVNRRVIPAYRFLQGAPNDIQTVF